MEREIALAAGNLDPNRVLPRHETAFGQEYGREDVRTGLRFSGRTPEAF